MNSHSAYQCSNSLTVLSHFPSLQRFVNDYDSDEIDAQLHMQARVRSGDYLTTLATELEKIAQTLAANSTPEAVELEKVVTELVYLGQNYTVTKK